MRIKAVISYDGSRFFGFQSQKHTNKTIQGYIKRALNRVGIDSKIVASGRTDTGVHATNQVIHFDIPKHWSDLEKLKNYLNRYLFPSIKIKNLYIVNDNFHARYWAKKRAYRYLIKINEPNPFEANYITFLNHLNLNKIEEAISLFEGEHDFKYFMKTGSETKSSKRKIYKSKLYQYKDLIIFYFEANGFLRSQIRMMVDFLIKIGKNELTKYQLLEQLQCKERYSTTLAPPYGLYLCKVIY
ncbi:tRNA pseudouridine(38-40) synthase TruA [Nitrosophilus kaiyonis]|uniref:tRNA pseudouridine(38-40) synthase TruA n=1 Tax=Nitrosophilus kaiyonis TaxID=2930200 RepID=UPI002491A471|nr:tRNA pseudouridine(38-40) synthase TruA [Nitrosophilus kaiyonis]